MSPFYLKNKYMEEWKPIEGYEGLYEVSNYGRLKSLSRTYEVHRNGFSYFQRRNEFIMKCRCNDSGYLKIDLSKNSNKNNYSIHRLVAMAFIPNPDNKPQVNHIDGNKLNNHVSNLEWCTPKENIQHGFKTGLFNNRKTDGEKNGNSKLTVNDVIKIKQLIKEGLTQTAISKMFGVTIPTINYIKNNKTWKHI